MKHSIKSVVLGLSLLLANGSIAYAQDFKKGSEAYKKKDFATALREWRPLAAQGDADAQYNLGLIYDTGQGVTQDFAEALKLRIRINLDKVLLSGNSFYSVNH